MFLNFQPRTLHPLISLDATFHLILAVFLIFLFLLRLLCQLLLLSLCLKRKVVGSLALMLKPGVLSGSSLSVWGTKARLGPHSDAQGGSGWESLGIMQLQ